MSMFFNQLRLYDKGRENAYLYWFLFMQQVAGYGKKHPLWADFGKIKDRSFDDWFEETGYELFTDDFFNDLQEIADADEYDRISSDPRYMIFYVDQYAPASSLLFWFKEIVLGWGEGSKKNGKKGRTTHRKETELREADRARYTFAQRPDVPALRTIYKCWIYKKEHPDKRLCDMALALKLVDKNDIETIKGEKFVKKDAKPTVNAAMSRYMRKARNIIKNIEQGKFPCYD